MLETLFGVPSRAGGSVTIEGKPVRLMSPGDAVAEGVVLVPSDRLRKSIIGSISAGENMLLPSYRALSWLGLRRLFAERGTFDRASSRLNLQPRTAALTCP
eukprot:gene23519-24995_t